MHFRLVIDFGHGELRLNEQSALRLAKDIADSEGVGCTVVRCSVGEGEEPFATVTSRGEVSRVRR